MRAIIGLGNPGKKYEKTRHNSGYLIVDEFAEQLQSSFKRGKGDYYYLEAPAEGERLLLVKPTTYMNLSGKAVGQVLRYFPISQDDIIIVYDDYHLPLGTMRFRPDGSHGGHNGVKSVIDVLGSNLVQRMRFGIGDSFKDSIDYVLSEFKRGEWKQVKELMPFCVDGLRHWVREGIEPTMNIFNRSYI